MIDRAVSLVSGRLNQHLRQRFEIADDLVAATLPTDAEGQPVPGARNKLLVFVTNITEETTARRPGSRPSSSSARGRITAEPLYLNVNLMLASNFDADNYLESLKVLSQAMQFFQDRPHFDHFNSPEMDKRLSQLVLEIENLDIDRSSNLWSIFGGRHLPSILYKMRLVALNSGAMLREDFLIRRPEGSARPRSEPAE